MTTITKAQLSNQECSLQEAVYHILPDLKLKRIFSAVYFVETNPPEERAQVLLSEKEVIALPDDGPRNLILIAIWKDQVQHSSMENTVY